jgi:DNA-binding NarL/FixJ family response regulator
MNTITLIVVEDDPDIGDMLCEFLRSKSEFNLLQVFTSVEKLLEQSSTVGVPDVVIMDIMLPGKSGIEGVTDVLRIWPDTKIVMNSVLKDNDAIYQSLQAGALGYISKDMPLESIKEAIMSVHAGGSYMNPQIARKVVAYFQKTISIREMLTEKEWQIAIGIKNGLSYKLVAEQNDMSIDGVRFYIQRIYRKLNINSRGQLSHIMS